jgi:hypothetical protein
MEKPMLQRVQEATNMSLELSIKVALMAAKTCSKALLPLSRMHGKSPCFSEVAFLRLLGPDCQQSILLCVNGAKNMSVNFVWKQVIKPVRTKKEA